MYMYTSMFSLVVVVVVVVAAVAFSAEYVQVTSQLGFVLHVSSCFKSDAKITQQSHNVKTTSSQR